MQEISITTAFAVSCITAKALEQFLNIGRLTVAEIVGFGDIAHKFRGAFQTSCTSSAKVLPRMFHQNPQKFFCSEKISHPFSNE